MRAKTKEWFSQQGHEGLKDVRLKTRLCGLCGLAVKFPFACSCETQGRPSLFTFTFHPRSVVFDHDLSEELAGCPRRRPRPRRDGTLFKRVTTQRPEGSRFRAYLTTSRYLF
jgi:hypothetical protein